MAFVQQQYNNPGATSGCPQPPDHVQQDHRIDEDSESMQLAISIHENKAEQLKLKMTVSADEKKRQHSMDEDSESIQLAISIHENKAKQLKLKMTLSADEKKH
jgi:ribosomal protein L29